MAIERRDFLALAASATATGYPSASSRATPRAGGDALRNWIVINALGGLGDPNHKSDSLVPELSPRVLSETHASGLTAVNATLGYVSGPDDPFEASVRDIAATDRLIRDHARDVTKILTVTDIHRAKAEGKVGLIYGFQNCAMMGKQVDRVDIFADLGVRIFQLTYNPANQIGDGSMAPDNRGLTPFGRQVVAKLNDRRMMVDLSHSGERTCLDAAQMSRQPISINHTGCRALTDLPRNKTDAELRLVAERGGFIGIYFMPFLNMSGHAQAADVVAHIDHAVNVCGEDHVGIGTDGDVGQIDDLQAYRAQLAEEIQKRHAAGIGATGERADTYPFVIDLRGPQQFRKLV
ncbi:MAG: membrane dipeptidase, partial [Sphingomonas sp.]